MDYRVTLFLAMKECYVIARAESLLSVLLLRFREVFDVVEDPPVNPAD